MSNLFQKLLEEKLQSRRRLAALPFEEKLAIVEQMRQRQVAISQSSLRVASRQPAQVVTIAINGREPTVSRTGVLKPRFYHPPATQSSNGRTVVIQAQQSYQRLG